MPFWTGMAEAGALNELNDWLDQETERLLADWQSSAGGAGMGDDGSGGGSGSGGGASFAQRAEDLADLTMQQLAAIGGRAGRDLAFSDPASYINLIMTEAVGENVSPMMRNFLIGNANRLYALASLRELSAPAGDTKEGMSHVNDVFKAYVTPGEEGQFSRANILQQLAAIPADKFPGATEQTPDFNFGDAFNFVGGLLAPTMTPLTRRALFSDSQQELQKAKYTTALVQGKFQGSAFDWLKQQGFV